MAMNPPASSENVPGLPNLGLKDLAELLVKHFDLHEGLFEVSFEFGLAVGGFKTPEGSMAPGFMGLINRVGLSAAQEASPNTVDAAVVNPGKTSTKTVRKKRGD